MSIQSAARGVRVAARSAYLVGRLRGSGSSRVVSVQDVASALQQTGQVAIPGSAPAATIVAAGTGISVAFAGVTYTVTNTGVLSVAAPAAGFSVNAATGAVTFTLTNDLAALEGLGSTGIAARTAADTWAQRTMTGTASRLAVTNGNGVSGNPTFDIDSAYVGQNTITTLGTVGTGTWQGTIIAGQFGGTGVANTGKTITLGGNLTVSGAFATTITVTAITNSTLPAGTHTLAGLDVAQTWSANQNFNSGNFLLNGSSSGALTIKPAAAAGTNTLTLPAGTTDFSATGGSNQIVKQTSVGGAFTVATQAMTEHSDFTTWTADTPTVTAGSGTFTTVSGSQRWIKIGKIIHVIGSVVVTTNGTAGTNVQVTLPSTGFSASGSIFATGINLSTAKAMTGAFSTNILFFLYDGTYPVASGHTFIFSYFYEVS